MKYGKCGFVDWCLKTPTMSIDQDTGVGDRQIITVSIDQERGVGEQTDRQIVVGNR